MESPEKLVIVGSGPAGLTAAIYGSRANLNPVMYMGSVPLGQLMLTSDVENYPGFPDPVMGPELMDRMKGQAERLGARMIQEDIVKVNFRNYPFELETSGGATIRALTVIVATGATPRRLNLDSEMRLMGKGVSNCAVCDGFFFKGKKVAVVGGGDTAMEEATYLSNIASSVQVIHRGSELRACATLKEEALGDPKIKFTWGSVVTDVLGNGKVEGVAIRGRQDRAGEQAAGGRGLRRHRVRAQHQDLRGAAGARAQRLPEGEERDGDQRPRGLRRGRRQGLQVPAGRHRRRRRLQGGARR